MSCPSTAGPCCTHESCVDQPYPCSSVSHVEMAQRWLLGVCISNWLCTIPPNPSPTLSAHQHTLFVCVCTHNTCTHLTHTHSEAFCSCPWLPLILRLLQSFLPICLYHWSFYAGSDVVWWQFYKPSTISCLNESLWKKPQLDKSCM